MSGLQVLPSGRESLEESKASDAVLKGFPAAFKRKWDFFLFFFFSILILAHETPVLEMLVG